MERPLSAISASTVLSNSNNTSTHKRNASTKSISKPIGPSVIQLFTTNLRLLDLDRLSDWPGITASSFSNADSRIRIRHCEYALYQLFRRYDAHTAADKLQPFFPPLEPLQSVNLRAALYRCLNDVKKNGALPKDAVLRKSMLDDCQGDKFWEVCLAFSAVVLQKVALERRTTYAQPVAEKIGTAQHVSKSEKESMLPLAVAHRAALSRTLAEKSRKREAYARLHDLLREKGQELRTRESRASQQLQTGKMLPQAKSNALADAIGKNWVGSIELKDALVDGDTCAPGDGILVESFDQLWKQCGEQGLAVSNGADVGLLQSLSSRATQQSVRLRMWQNYLDRLVAARPVSRPSRASSRSQKAAIRFTEHQDINLKDSASEEDEDDEQEPKRTEPRRVQPPQRNATASRYDTILTAMREELRKNALADRTAQSSQSLLSPLKRANTQPIPVRQPSLAVDTMTGAQDPQSRTSQTAVPMRPRMGRRVISQSKTYEKPKVESQREPIPLKAELFSPLKENRRSHPSFNSTTPILPEAGEEALSRDALNGAGFFSRPGVTDSPDVNAKDETDSGVDLRTEIDARRASVDDASSVQSSLSNDEPTVITTTAPKMDPPQETFKVPALSAARQTIRPSLAERTRMSIAFNSAEDVQGFLPDQPQPRSSALSDPHKDQDTTALSPLVSTGLDRQISLLDRTRDSILKAPPADINPAKRPPHTRSRSSLYPVNQFETPKKARSSTIGAHDVDAAGAGAGIHVAGGKRDPTPMEQLMSPDAEYASVFKSRPKIALSPVLSARRGGETNVDVDGGLDEDRAALSSPLAGVASRT